MREYLFDDFDSILHAILGFLAAFWAIYNIWLAIFWTAVYILFVIYEVQEPEKPTATVGDAVEFILGFCLGLLWGIIYWVI